MILVLWPLLPMKASTNSSLSLQTSLAGDLFLLGQLLPELNSLAPSCAALSGKRKRFQLSPLTQTFKSKHWKATDHVHINKIGLRKALPQEPKGCLKHYICFPRRQAAKPQQFQRFVCLSRAGWLGHRILKRKCHPWYRRTASPRVLKVPGRSNEGEHVGDKVRKW
jgi:hypothetical protein